MKKKILSIAMCLTIISTILAGCTDDRAANAEKPQESIAESSALENKIESSSQTDSTVVESNVGEDSSTENVITSAVDVVEITPEVSNEAYMYSDGMGRFSYNSKVGYLGIDGKVIIEPKYETSSTIFSEGLAIAEKMEGGLAIIDKNGKEVAANSAYRPITSCGEFSGGVAIVYSITNKTYAGIDTTGKVLFELESAVKPAGVFSNGVLVCVALNSNSVFVIDQTGKEVVPSLKTGYGPNNIPDLKYTDNFLALPDFDRTCNMIDTTGKRQFEENFEELKQPAEGFIPYMKYSKWGYIDYMGTVVIEAQYENAYSFSNGLAAVQVNGKIGYIDSENNMVIEPQFQIEPQVNTIFPLLFKFNDDGLALVPDSDGSLIDMQGTVVLSAPERANIFYSGNGMICYANGGKSYLYKIGK